MNVSDTIPYMAANGRLAPEDWVTAGLEVLMESGVTAVKILPTRQAAGCHEGQLLLALSRAGARC